MATKKTIGKKVDKAVNTFSDKAKAFEKKLSVAKKEASDIGHDISKSVKKAVHDTGEAISELVHDIPVGKKPTKPAAKKVAKPAAKKVAKAPVKPKAAASVKTPKKPLKKK